MIKFNKSSSSNQDVFAYQVCGPNKTYIEIGAADAIIGNNTFSLEKNHGWQGFSLEFNKKRHSNSWKKRSNSIFWEDALNFNYEKTINDLGFSEIDYLQFDIDPAHKTFSALEKVLNANIKFKCCTFEHDLYRTGPDDKNYKELADTLLIKNGYKIAVDNVVSGKNNKYYETWYVCETINWNYKDFNEWQNEIKEWAEFINYEEN